MEGVYHYGKQIKERNRRAHRRRSDGEAQQYQCAASEPEVYREDGVAIILRRRHQESARESAATYTSGNISTLADP